MPRTSGPIRSIVGGSSGRGASSFAAASADGAGDDGGATDGLELAAGAALGPGEAAGPDGGAVGGAETSVGGTTAFVGATTMSGSQRVPIETPSGSSCNVAASTGIDSLASGAIATSSIAINQWHDAEGRSLHHLIDPSTGEPGGDGLLAVTVAGPDTAWAEVWSKSLFLAGVDGIAALARSRGLASWWIRDDGELEMTPAARVRTLWSATDS